MESTHKELGFLASAVLAAGFIAPTAEAQTQTSPANQSSVILSRNQFRENDPVVAVRIFPLSKLTNGPFLEADDRKKPRLEVLLPDKRYYEQKDNYSLDLGYGATAKMKGPMRVRVTIPLP